MKRFKNGIAFFLIIALFDSAVFAQSVIITTDDEPSFGGSGSTPVYQSDKTTLLPSGNLITIGTFGSIDFASINTDGVVDPSTELLTLRDNYTQFPADGSGTSLSGEQIGATAGDFTLEFGNAATAGTSFENQDLYLTVFKLSGDSSILSPDWTNVFEVGVFRDSNWDFGSLSSPQDTLTLRTEQVDKFLIGSQGSLVLAPAPEPSHFALAFGLIGLGVVVWRRRRERS